MLPVRIGTFVDKYCTDIIRVRLYKLLPSFSDTSFWVKAIGQSFRFICSHCHLVAVYKLQRATFST